MMFEYHMIWVKRSFGLHFCDLLYKHNENAPILKHIVMGNEKWIVYKNVKWKRSRDKRYEPPLATLKAGLHPKKVMLSIWWDGKRVLYKELLPSNQLINSEKYCLQPDNLKMQFKKNAQN